MIMIFGTKACPACCQKIKELDEKKTQYEYYDLETTDGLAVAAYYQVLGVKQLPIIVELKNKK